MRIVAVATLLALGAPGLAGAQHDSPRFRHLGTEDGLSQGTALAIAQDAAGFLWIGTQAGLHRYDGQELEVYRADPADSTSLPDDFVTALLVDGSGDLWVGTAEGGLARYDRERDQFVHYPLTKGDTLVGPDASREIAIGVTALAEVDGYLWVGASRSLGLVDVSNGRVSWPAWDEPVDAVCESLLPAPRGALLAGCGDGTVRLLRYDESAASVRTDRTTDLGARVSVLSPSGDSVVVGTWGRGAHVVDADGARPRPLRLPGSSGNGAAVVMAATEDRFGHLWIGTRVGLAELAPNGKVRHHTAVASDPTSLSHSEITALHEDRTGVLWIGTFDGLNSLSHYRNAILRYTAESDGRGLLPSPGVVGIDGAGDGGLWIGTMGGDVAKIDLELGTTQTYRPDGTTQGSTGGDVMSLSVDTAGNPWVTVWGRGIAHISAKTGRIEQIFETEGGETGLRDAVAIRVDHAGRVWVGSATGGLLTLDSIDRSVRHFVDAEGAMPFCDTYVWPIREPDPGVLWVGTAAARGGVHRIGEDRHVQSWTYEPATNDGLGPGRVLTTLVASDGSIWIGTYEGLTRLEPWSGRIRIYRAADGLPHDIVEGVLEDDEGRIWIATDNGLGRLDPATGELRVFHVAAGLQGEKFYANAAFKDRQGHLYFGGPGGLTVIRPELLAETRSHPPSVVVTGFSVLGEERQFRSSTSARVALELESNENFFTFSFAALDFVDPEHNRYRYMLEGLDANWVDAGTEGSASYTSVPPGQYTFLVSAANSEGVWRDRALQLPLVIHPPYYQTLWFRSGVLLLMGLALFIAYRYRMQQIQRLAAVRTRIAGELHDDIGANLSAIAMKAELVQRVLDVGSSDSNKLRDIERMARETTQKVREMIWVVRDEHDSLEGLARHIKESASTLLSGVVEYDLSVSPSLPDRPIGMELRRDIYSLYKEALHNALKHSGAQHVEIDVAYQDGKLSLLIRDDGSGFDPAAVVLGNGLELMKHRAQKHDAELDVRSAPNHGTSVMLRVQLS